MAAIDLQKKSPVASKTTAAKKPVVKKPGVPITVNQKLGVLLRDKITGFEGLATGRSDMLTGCTQFSVQPQGKPDAILEGKQIDYHTLEVIGPGISDIAPIEDQTVTLKLGQKVRDKISGYTGTTVDRVTFFNGCVYFGVQREATASNMFGELPQPLLFPHGRLILYRSFGDILSDFFAAWFAPRVKKEKAPKPMAVVLPASSISVPKPPVRRPPGGPMRALHRQ